MEPSWKASDPVPAFLFIGREIEAQKGQILLRFF